jgi:hypothetical protein
MQVRSTAGGTSLGTQNSGAIGTVTGGGEQVSLSGINYFWWNVNFDSGIDGYVIENYLQTYTAPPSDTTPTPTPPPTSGGSTTGGGTSGGSTSTGGSTTGGTGTSPVSTPSSGGGTIVYTPPSTTTTTNTSNTSTTTCVQTTTAKLTRNLYRTTKGDDVKILQNFLISQNLLSSDSNTGYFGPLTEKAVQSFQKSQNIVSSGTPLSTGYGNVGPTTRTKINSMLSSTSCSSVTQTTQSLQEQIKILQSQVNALLLQLQKGQ